MRHLDQKVPIRKPPGDFYMSMGAFPFKVETADI
jgi:hypothetical protein